MFSTLTERGASATLDALERGASDYVTKPANVGSVSASMEAVRSQLIPKVKSLHRRSHVVADRSVPGRRTDASPSLVAAPPAPTGAQRPPGGRVDVVVIGASTGGPDALTTVIGALPGNLPVPVVVVQHMPPVFTALFAQRLDTKSALAVSEARHGDRPRAGTVLIAPGDHHLRLRSDAGGPVGVLDQGVPENYCRPAVDVLFRTATDVYGAHVLAVVLTGMGSDGARGAARIVETGGSVIAQDQPTSVVWGMPGAVTSAGLASAVLPLSQVAQAIQARVARGRTFTTTRQDARS
jgi:two-component system chemotaxis response regulator CheB